MLLERFNVVPKLRPVLRPFGCILRGIDPAEKQFTGFPAVIVFEPGSLVGKLTSGTISSSGNDAMLSTPERRCTGGPE
jgi:hypothetical protein